jgi:hypothetical protein
MSYCARFSIAVHSEFFVCRAAMVAMSPAQEAAFQLYRPIIARVIPPTPEPAKIDAKPEDGEVAAEEGEIEVPKPAAPEPGA